MLLDLLNTKQNDFSEFSTEVSFKLSTILFAFVYTPDCKLIKDNFKSFHDLMDLTMLSINNMLSIKESIIVTSKFVDDLSPEKFKNPIISTDVVQDSIKMYKDTYIKYLKSEYKNDIELTNIYTEYLTKRLNNFISKEEYLKAAEYRDLLKNI